MQDTKTAPHIAFAHGHVEVAVTLLKHIDKKDMVSLGKKRSYIIA